MARSKHHRQESKPGKAGPDPRRDRPDDRVVQRNGQPSFRRLQETASDSTDGINAGDSEPRSLGIADHRVETSKARERQIGAGHSSAGPDFFLKNAMGGANPPAL